VDLPLFSVHSEMFFRYLLTLLTLSSLVNGELKRGEFLINGPAASTQSIFEKEYNYLHLLANNPQNIAANIDLGLLYVEQEQHILAQKYLKHAIVYGNWSNVTALTNFALELSHLNGVPAALTFLQLARHLFHPQDPNVIFMQGLLHLKGGDLTACHSYYREVLTIKPVPEFYIFIIASFNDYKVFTEANDYIAQAVRDYPEHSRLLFVCGLNFHFQSRYDLALEFYQMSGKLNPSYDVVYINIAGIYQMLGNLKEAKSFYQHVFDRVKDDSGFLNNFGSLLLAMNEYDEGERLLKQSIAINPEQEHAPVNLAGYYQDEGLLEEAEELLRHAVAWSDNAPQLELRMATLLSPVMRSWPHTLRERRRMERQVAALNSQLRPPDHLLRPLMSGLDRIHFYIQYHGLNDRKVQESIARAYRRRIKDIDSVAPHLSPTASRPPSPFDLSAQSTLIRIGFMSKLFGVFEPHGLLLDGVIKYLPRSRFRVVALEVAAGGAQKQVSPLIMQGADEVVQISLDHVHAAQTLTDLHLDILVFADVLSEPMNHFLLHSRFARIQIAFWGNPITSGSHHVDYFMSADFMEHPFRTRIPVEQEPYSEQVILTPGQGIWYYHPQSAEMKQCDKSIAQNLPHIDTTTFFTREHFNLHPDWFVFLCPQSVFKLHPLFDQVVAAILRASPVAHVVFTSGRRPRWTQTFVGRLQQALDPRDARRCHVVERVSSEKFIEFIKIADVLLHPFPFDGSRTSADSIAANIPYVTLPTEYLRGRMGASFLRTMNIPELVAENVTDYVNIAVRLSVDATFFRSLKKTLHNRSWLIWEDMEVPYAWTKFLSLSTGEAYSLSYEEYLLESCGDRNVTHEVQARHLREANQQRFDERWAGGRPQWLLDGRGVAVLEDDVQGDDEHDELPRIFRNWQNSY
jgi:protein O-GlcNAc transferase